MHYLKTIPTLFTQFRQTIGKLKCRRLLLISVSIVALLSCSDTKLSPLAYNAKVIAFGDSLTAGNGVTKEYNYPSILSSLTQLEVVNAGISGETTSKGLLRFTKVLDAHQADLIILLEGGNDILRNQDLTRTKQNLAAMIEQTQARSIDIILLGVPQKKLFSSSASLYRELAEEYNLVFDGDIIAELMRTPSAKSDSVHFNQKGYRLLAERVYQLMQDNHAL